MNKYFLDSLKSTDLENLLGRDGIVLLAGSGISIWSPTELPAGQDFTSAVLNTLFDSANVAVSQKEMDKLRLLLNKVPFEALMERCPHQYKLKELLAKLFGGPRKPNPIHNSLAELALNNRLSSIITTNYDLALDEALGDRAVPLPVVFRESHLRLVNDRAYFKIHGSTQADNQDTLVYSLQLEAALRPWKRKLLRTLINGRVLLIIGYSGFDFEVCPEIPRAGPIKVIWNFKDNAELEMSPGYDRLISDGLSVIPLVGNMWRLLHLLGFRLTETIQAETKLRLESELTDTFSRDELLLWRVRVLNSMGHGRLSYEAVMTLNAKENATYETLKEYAQSEHHRGKYRDAERSYLRAADLAPDDLSRRMVILDASDEARCFGHWRRAGQLIDVATENSRASLTDSELSQLRARELLKRTLVLGHWIQITSLLHRILTRLRLSHKFGIAERLQRERDKAARWTSEGARLAIENGLWFDFQQFRLWGDRMGLSFNLVMSAGPFEPPPSREGYAQLGYKLALLMVARDQAKLEKMSGTLREETLRELKDSLEVANQLGCSPEAWKILRILVSAQHGGIRDLMDLCHHFFLCQYAWSKRVPYLLLGA